MVQQSKMSKILQLGIWKKSCTFDTLLTFSIHGRTFITTFFILHNLKCMKFLYHLNRKLIKLAISIFLLVFIVPYCHSQTDSLNKILIKWTPTALIGYSSLQFAGEFYYTGKRSVQLEYGIILPHSFYNSNEKGHKIRLEHRNYFNKQETWYLAPELNFVFVQYDTEKRFSENPETESYINSELKTVGMQKIISTANFKIGYQYIFKKPKIALDFYVGLGVRYVNTTFTSYPTVGEYIPPIDNWLAAPFEEGNRVIPNGIVGVKIGYKIK